MGRTNLDWHIRQAQTHADRGALETIADLRWQLLDAAKRREWERYNEAAKALNTQYGATVPLVTISTAELTFFMSPEQEKELWPQLPSRSNSSTN